MKRIFMAIKTCFLIVFFVFFGGLKSVYACTWIEDSSTSTNTFAPPPIVVQRDAPVGTVIWQGQVWGSNLAALNCGNEIYDFTASTGSDTGIIIYNGYHVYSTNVPGIGYSLSSDCDNEPFSGNFGHCTNGASAQYFPERGITAYGTMENGEIGIVGYYGRGSLALVVTGKTSSGTVNAGELGRLVVGGQVYQRLVLGNAAPIIVSACSLNNTSLTFPIGNVPVNKFGASPGIIPAGAENTQNLGLDCDANANINVSLSGTQNPDVSDTSVLALTGQGSEEVAGGVGVQLLYNSTPLKLNERILLKTSSGGQETFPLVARYYQTKSTVTTGKANASATLDLTYQ
ncbi:fimbrial protein [Cronobacter turicensis]